ncbi:MAG: hypothetical protein KGZ83_02730 [Sulfuricella sp.]|nr:hypothetical protein [Sulfuricella sp.]
MRVKTHWHKDGKQRTVPQVASVVALIIWKVTEETVTHIQQDKFEIASQEQAFAMIEEFLAFFIQLADRVSYVRLGSDLRPPFMQALAKRIAETFDENALPRLGPPGEEGYKSRFIATLNQRLGDYAGFDYADEPDFPVLRYLGNRIMDVMAKHDQSWIIDQIIEIEAPRALAQVQKGLRELLVPDGMTL